MNKIKLYVYITNHEYYVNGEYNWCFDVYHDPKTVERIGKDYTLFTEIEADVIDVADATQKAVAGLDKEIQNIRAQAESRVKTLEDRRDNLKALEHKS